MSDDRDGWIFTLVLIGAPAFIWYAGGINEAWYSVRFFVPPSKVHVDPKPKDCDFLHAPFGDKGCHYKASVSAVNSDGQVIGGDDAPKYGQDTQTGKPIISWDGGKTWDWMATLKPPNRNIAYVTVTWSKIEE